jgi:hypothetical protein
LTRVEVAAAEVVLVGLPVWVGKVT